MNPNYLFDCECPICGSYLKETIYDSDRGCLHDGVMKCSNGCCWQEFAFGSSRIFIFNKEFIYSYNTKQEEMLKLEEEVRKEIAHWRENERYLTELMNI